MAAVGSVNAMFIVLKPGVVYQQDVGSFVLEATDHPEVGDVPRFGGGRLPSRADRSSAPERPPRSR